MTVWKKDSRGTGILTVVIKIGKETAVVDQVEDNEEDYLDSQR